MEFWAERHVLFFACSLADELFLSAFLARVADVGRVGAASRLRTRAPSALFEAARAVLLWSLDVWRAHFRRQQHGQIAGSVG